MPATPAKRLFLAGAGGTVLLFALLLFLAFPSSEAVRLRNAFLIEAGQPTDFAWTPANRPADFRWEGAALPAELALVAREVAGADGDDFARARRLAAHLLEHADDKGAIQSGLRETYRGIRAGYGYCADFVRVFLAMAHGAGIATRQWAFSFDGFGGHGHTFVEVFEPARQRWLMLDVFSNLYPVSEAGEPLSALDFRSVLLDTTQPVRLARISAGRLEFPIEAKAVDYYRRGASEWYLWWGNDVVAYDARPWRPLAARLGRAGEQAVALLADAYPRFRVLDPPGNEAALQRMYDLRRQLAVLLALLAACLLLAVGAGFVWWRQAGR